MGTTLHDDASAWGSLAIAPLGIDPVTGNFSFMALPNAFYNAFTGTLTSNQQAQILSADDVANLQAGTNPITGVVNQSLVNAADTEAGAEIGPASNVTGVNTGSWLANLTDALGGTYTGPLGLPGMTPPLGTPVPGGNPPTGQIDWTSILETVAIGAVVIVGGYVVIKAIF